MGLQVLELTFEDEPTWSTWLEGLRALHAALSYGGEPRKLEWLLLIFRLADTANLGSVRPAQAAALRSGGCRSRPHHSRPNRIHPDCSRPHRSLPR